MKKHLKKIIVIIIILALHVLGGFYLQRYLRERGEQSGRFIEKSESISQTQKQQESNKIYQDNKVVGEIVGEVNTERTDIVFEQLNETSALKKNIPIEYQGVKYVIIRMDNYIKEYKGKKSKIVNDILQGKCFVITGFFDDYKRTELKQMILSNGGRVIGSISSSTDYLLAGEKPGSKLKKAEELNVEIIDIVGFIKLIRKTEQMSIF